MSPPIDDGIPINLQVHYDLGGASHVEVVEVRRIVRNVAREAVKEALSRAARASCGRCREGEAMPLRLTSGDWAHKVWHDQPEGAELLAPRYFYEPCEAAGAREELAKWRA